MVEQVEQGILGSASPEAKLKFREMLQGLQSGTLSLNDLRGQAKSALDQLNQFKSDFEDEDLSSLLDSYGAILEKFLSQTGSKSSPSAGGPAKKNVQKESGTK
jgi:hypothetical protein